MRNKPKGINHKLFKVMGIQLALISLVTLLSVYGAAKVVEDVLIKEALDGEADFFWQHYEKDKTKALPKTLNLTGYFADSKNLPEALKGVKEGYHSVALDDDKPLVHVSNRFDKTLILVFKEGQVARLAFYFGVAPLAFVLLIIYLPAWISFMMSRRAISPVVKLAKLVDNIEISETADISADFSEIEGKADAEVLTLIKAFEHYSKEVTHYVRREKNFTRYASHELRTPLAVMKGSIALLTKQDLSENSQKIVSRMSKVVNDMERLIDALLLLSRNEKGPAQDEAIDLVEVVNAEIEKIRLNYPSRDLAITLNSEAIVHSKVPQYLFSICVTNILNNAVNYDETGRINVTITENRVVIKDSGQGMSESELERIYNPFYRGEQFRDTTKGFGLGMAIVKTISERMNWQIEIESELGNGTQVTLKFEDEN